MSANSGKKNQGKPTWEQIQRDRDERVKLPLEPDEALSGLMEVDPEDAPAGEGRNEAGASKGSVRGTTNT